MQMNVTKTCCKCKKDLVAGYYGKRKTASDGLNPTCKTCRKEEYIKNRISILEKMKLQYENNKHDILIDKKEYRIKCKSKIKTYNNTYYKIHRDKIISYQSTIQNKSISEVSNKYVLKRIKSQLGICDLNVINTELIEIKRTIIKTKRLCKTLKNSEVN